MKKNTFFTPYKQYLTFFVVLTLLLILFVNIEINPIFGIIFIPILIVILVIIMQSIKCPNCGTPVGGYGFMHGIKGLFSLFDTSCVECGYDLNKNDKEL